MHDPHPYEQLSLEIVIDAVESTGRVSDLRVFPLNSYENRVYQVGVEDGEPLIAKFYRPQRWSDAQIQEEHDFCKELTAVEIPVVAPLADAEGRTLFQSGDFRFALYPRRGGHAPELENPDCLLQLGRLMGRLHNVGATRDYRHRPRLTVAEWGWESYRFVAEHWVPRDLKLAYTSLCEDLLPRLDALFAEVPARYQRIHGDAHVGNILARGEQYHLVDLDDSRSAPCIQDLWMFLSGDRANRTAQLSELMDGYQEFADFDPRELHLVEGLRTLRLMHYAAWLGRRWEDPAFPRHFPWFADGRYWSDHILELREQLAALDEPPLSVY